MFRKIAFVLIAILFCFTSLAAEQALAKEKKTVAMIRWRYKDKSEEGFESTVKASPDYDVTIIDYGVEENKEKLENVVKSLDPKKVDLIYTQTTPCTQAVKKLLESDAVPALKNIPVIFNIVLDPVGAGIAASWESSGNNFTGASNWVSVDAVIKTVKKVVNLKKLGMFFNPNEKPVVIQRDAALGLQEKYGFILVAAQFTGKQDLESALATFAAEKVDAIWVPNSPNIKSNEDLVLTALNDKKLPVISSMVDQARRKDKESALLGLGPNYYKLGELAGKSALEIFKGKKPSEIPTGVLQTVDLVINLKTATKIGKRLPVELLKKATEIIE